VSPRDLPDSIVEAALADGDVERFADLAGLAAQLRQFQMAAALRHESGPALVCMLDENNLGWEMPDGCLTALPEDIQAIAFAAGRRAAQPIVCALRGTPVGEGGTDL